MPINRVHRYNARALPNSDRERTFVLDLIDLLGMVQSGKCELRQFHSRVRQYVWDAQVTPFIWTPVDHLMHGKTSQ